MTSNSVSGSKGRIPSIYRQPRVIMEMDLTTWKALLVESGECSSNDAEKLTREKVQKIVCDDHTVSDTFIDALSVIHEFGNEDGRHLLEQASADINLDLQISDDDSDSDLAARVWMASQTSTPHKQTLIRAHTANVFARRRSNVREYVGDRSFSLAELDQTMIRSLLSECCQENKKSGVVDIYTFQENGFWFCNIVRGDPIKTVAAIENQSQISHQYRPAAWDQICIEPESGRIGISTRSPKFVEAYRSVFGEVLKGDSEFFSGENICTLTPLFDHQLELFQNLPYNVHRVSVTELQWKHGRESAVFRGPDSFKTLRNLKAELRIGHLSEAKLNFYFAGSARPSSVHIKVSNRIEITADEHETTIMQYLNVIGLRGRFDESEEKSFWSLAPWEYSETVWRRYIGDDFDYLFNKRCFTAVDLSWTNDPESVVPNPMRIERIQEGTVVGIDDDSIIRTLTPTEHQGFKLNLHAIGSVIANKISLEGTVYEIGQGLWSLGCWSKSDKVQIQVFLATTQPSSHTACQIKESSCGNRPILLIPEGCHCDIGIPLVHCQFTKDSHDYLMQKIVNTLGIQDLLEPPLWLSHDIILDSVKGKVWYKGQEIRNIDTSMQAFKFLEKLMEAGGAKVDKYDLNHHISLNNFDEKVAAQAKKEFLKKIRKTYSDLALELPSDIGMRIFRSHTGGYSMNCSFCFIS